MRLIAPILIATHVPNLSNVFQVNWIFSLPSNLGLSLGSLVAGLTLQKVIYKIYLKKKELVWIPSRKCPVGYFPWITLETHLGISLFHILLFLFSAFFSFYIPPYPPLYLLFLVVSIISNLMCMYSL